MDTDELHPQAAAAVERQQRVQQLVPTRSARLLRVFSRLEAWRRDPPPVAQVVDRTIPGPGGEIPIRVYRPGGETPFPTVVFFHGGGFVSGGLESHDALCRYLTRESGCVVVSVDYRLAPEHPFPAAAEDAIAATEWAAEHTRALGGTGKLAVAGDSAGGNLAAVAALAARDRGEPEKAYQALIYPGVGVDRDQESVREYDGLVLSEDDLEWFNECYYGSELHRHNPYADPIAACDLSGVAPATVLTAGFDPLRDGGVAYAERLQEDGVDVRHVEYEDMIHGFVASTDAIDRATEAIADVAADLRDALGA
ncbi:alpha/beta hydrolase [Halapricum hydrolyticum]|uniref:Alpha/beta hydrolase n=1 Tax=Halapricum hydrolyticum TaxID=2979991 RepID=A0AAE3LF64_9EURY|nr:alpha/beta hydrolase [Halapricum hydrolyticum]MCU4717826.1 alpha/beta hydrolase [Halapricum hydrolyticum]MCU4726990.1 alpha/beta hydrolase [Halapricum hydrolyticum]